MHASDRFLVSLHDLTPANVGDVAVMVDAVAPWVGATFSVAVIPHRPATAAERRGVVSVAGGASEVLLHGLTHRRGRSFDPFSWLVGFNDEFAALTPEQTATRLREGKRVLQDEYAIDARGTVPPCWRGRHVAGSLAAAGLDFVVGFRHVESACGRRVSLSTGSWDPGPVRPLWRACEIAGHAALAANGAVPCVTLHPADVRRGLLPRAVQSIRRHLDAGRRPTTFAALLQTDETGASPSHFCR